MLIISWVLNIMKPKWVKVGGKLSVGQNPSLFIEENFTKTCDLLLHSYFSLKQT